MCDAVILVPCFPGFDLISSLVCCFAPCQAIASCPPACQCPREVPRCAPGVGLVLDDCRCCKVCAKQLNEDCSRSQPCDHTKGLQCNFGASSTALKGICRGKTTLACGWAPLKSICGSNNHKHVFVAAKFSNLESMYGYTLLLVDWQKGII